jgi:hypothetical protein
MIFDRIPIKFRTISRSSMIFFIRIPPYPSKKSHPIWHSLHTCKISGHFPVICKMKLISGKIRGGFPVIQSKITHFHVFQVHRRNFSFYSGYFQCNLQIKRNFFVYLKEKRSGTRICTNRTSSHF